MSFKDIWADKLSALFGRKEEIIPMYLIVGLGNPGKQYDMTRHNIGFHTIDYIADKYGAKLTKLKFKAVYGEATISGEKVYLVKPQTYMNLSGDSVGEMAQFYKIPPENIIVINDDISLDVGIIRVRPKGSAGGHNGIKSIIAHLGTQEFPRVKVGLVRRVKQEVRGDFQSGANAARVGAVAEAPVAIGVDVQRVVEVVAVRRAEPPVGGRFESHPISSGEPAGYLDFSCSFRSSRTIAFTIAACCLSSA